MGEVNMNLLGCLVHILVLHATIVFGLTFHLSLNVDVGNKIKNNEYPNYYRQANYSVLTIISPNSARITLNCPVFEIPNTDTLLIEVVGQQPIEWRGYLPRFRYFTVDQINLTMTAAYNSRGGRFLCLITALFDPFHSTTTTTTISTPALTTLPSTETCNCGYRQANRIVGGKETGVNEYPFMAGLVDIINRMIFCGATIISERFLITAGQCVYNIKISATGVLVGDHDISRGTDTTFAALYIIDWYLIHESYVDRASPNDIAIIRTTDAIIFSVAVGPVCLPYTLWVNDGNYNVTELGWGSLIFGGPMSDTLQEINLATITNYQCEQAYGRNISYSQICTFSKDKDSCQYDAGGPAVYFDPTKQRYILIGIISYGRACSGFYPGVCTRVQSFIPWIERHTGIDFCRI